MLIDEIKDLPFPDSSPEITSADELYEQTKSARIDRQYEKAAHLAKTLSFFPKYHWEGLYELSIVLYYINDNIYRSLGSKIIDYLKFSSQCPEHLKKSTHLNSIYYYSPIKYLSYHSLELPSTDPHLYPLNPSFLVVDGSYYINCRSVNYILTENGSVIHHPEKITLTRNFFLFLSSPNLSLIHSHEIMDHSLRFYYRKACQGYEDLRLFHWDEPKHPGSSFWFLSTTWDTHPEDYARITLGHLNKDFHIDFSKVLKGPNSKRHEKNWIPLVKDDLYIIYSFSPFIVLKPNLETGETQKVIEKKWDHNYNYFRGGTTPIKLKLHKPGFLFLIHEVVDLTNRYYLTRGVWISDDFEEIKITPSFYFLERGIEFAIGLSYAPHDETKIVVGVGVNDRKAFLFFLDINIIKNLLN